MRSSSLNLLSLRGPGCPKRQLGPAGVKLLLITLIWLRSIGLVMQADEPAWPVGLVGYTQLRTNLPGGRLANVRTMRAMVVRADGTGARELSPELIERIDNWTQFAGWSPDGIQAVVGRGWESEDNAAWEEEHKTFRFDAESYLYDTLLVDLDSAKSDNVTAVDRVSFYNTGVFFWPNDSTKLGFTALIEGNSHPFRMDRDGRNKTDLTLGSKEFAYGFSSSNDGRRIAYHKNYQVYVADADGSNAKQIITGNSFNFAPSWSADGRHMIFLSGEHYGCHPHVVNTDGTGLRKLADRGGYRGVVEFLDVADFHGGSSDVPIWSASGDAIFHTAQVGKNVELFRTDLAGNSVQLTRSPEGTLHYHPQPSADGEWLLYGSKRDGVRQLYIMRLDNLVQRRLTECVFGQAAMWPHWQPTRIQRNDAS